MKPCMNPSICGVHNHRVETECLALMHSARTNRQSSSVDAPPSLSSTSARPKPPHVEYATDMYLDYIDEDEIEVLNHSGALPNDDVVTLSEMRENRGLLSGNCFSASSSISESLRDPEHPAQMLSLSYKDGHSHHVVLITSPDGSDSVIDFTAAQYSDKFPVPYIADRNEWRVAIADAVWDKHKTIIEEEKVEEDW